MPFVFSYCVMYFPTVYADTKCVEDQVILIEFKSEDIDPPVNAVIEIAEDHDKQSYEDHNSNPPVIEVATYPP